MNVDELARLDARTRVEWVSARIDSQTARLKVLYQLRRAAMWAMRIDGHTHVEVAAAARLGPSQVGRVLSGGAPNNWQATVDRLAVAERLLLHVLRVHGAPAGVSPAEAGLAALLLRQEPAQPSERSARDSQQ